MDLSGQCSISPSFLGLHILSLLLLWFILGVKWMPFIWSSATLLTLLRMPCSFADLMIADYLLGYVNWFHSLLTSIMSPVRYSASLASACALLPDVSKGTFLLPPKCDVPFSAPVCVKLAFAL
jgi:hypothetical protein